MNIKIRIPLYAKQEAKDALAKRKLLSKDEKFGLNKKQAKLSNVRSGVEQAKRLVNNKFLTKKEAFAYYRFYQRFKGCKTSKCEGAIKLCGGRRFGKMLSNVLN